MNSPAARTCRQIGVGIGRFFALRNAPETIAPSVQAGLTSALTIVVACLIFGPKLGAISLFGSMLALWEADRPVWPRIRNAILIASTMSASMVLGVLVAPYRWMTLPFIVVMILVTTTAYYAFMLTRGPGPLHLFYAGTLGTFFGMDPALGWRIVGVVVFATFFTGALTLVTLVAAPRRPERTAVTAAAIAVRTYRDSEVTSPDERRHLRNAAYRAVNRAWLTLQSTWPANEGLAHRARARELLAVNRELASAVLTADGRPAGIRELTPDTPLLLGRPGFRFLAVHAVRPDSVAWFTAWRMALAAAVAGGVSQAAGIGHPYWAVLTSTIILHQWIDRIATTRRAAHRAIGTVLGLGIVAIVVTVNPGPWWVVAIVVAFTIGQDVLVPLNYALGLILITPMSLLAIEAAGSDDSLRGLLGDRLVETMIGALAAVLVTWATSRCFPERLLRAQSRRARAAVTAVDDVNAHDAAFTDRGRTARVELQFELLHHLTVVERAVADDRRLTGAAMRAYADIDRGYLSLARAWQTAAPAADG